MALAIYVSIGATLASARRAFTLPPRSWKRWSIAASSSGDGSRGEDALGAASPRISATARFRMFGAHAPVTKRTSGSEKLCCTSWDDLRERIFSDRAATASSKAWLVPTCTPSAV